MKKRMLFLLATLAFAFGFSGFSFQKNPVADQEIPKDSIVHNAAIADSLALVSNLTLKAFKNNAHVSYYHDRFNGRRTASGKKFNNSDYTAAHRKLPFGTKLKVTNPRNGKSVVVTVTDRGPFTKGRELDVTKRAFMDIASDKRSGTLTATIEIIE